MWDSPQGEELLWERLENGQGKTYQTAKGLSYTYVIRGKTLYFSRKDKPITRSSVMVAFHRALEVQKEAGCVKGPKTLQTFGASYLYPVFLELGVCTARPEAEGPQQVRNL